MNYSQLYVGRIRKLCEQRKLSINGLAKKSGVKLSALDNIMSGNTKNPGVATLHKVAVAFNKIITEFLDFEELDNYSFADEKNL